MKLGHFNGYEVSGFEYLRGWRLHVRSQDATSPNSYFYSDGKFYQSSVDLPPNSMNEAMLSPLVPVTPTIEEERAMFAAVLEWVSDEPTPKEA